MRQVSRTIISRGAHQEGSGIGETPNEGIVKLRCSRVVVALKEEAKIYAKS